MASCGPAAEEGGSPSLPRDASSDHRLFRSFLESGFVVPSTGRACSVSLAARTAKSAVSGAVLGTLASAQGFAPIPTQPCMLHAECKDDSGLLTPVNASDITTPSSCSTSCTTSPDASPSAATSSGGTNGSAFTAAAINCAAAAAAAPTDSSVSSPSRIDRSVPLGVGPADGSTRDGLAAFLSQKEQWFQLLVRNAGRVSNRLDRAAVLGDLKGEVDQPRGSDSGVPIPSKETVDAFSAFGPLGVQGTLLPRGVAGGCPPGAKADPSAGAGGEGDALGAGVRPNAATELAALSSFLQTQTGGLAAADEKRREEAAMLLLFQQLQKQQLARQTLPSAGAQTSTAAWTPHFAALPRGAVPQPQHPALLPYGQPATEPTKATPSVRTDAPLIVQAAAALDASTPATGRVCQAGQVKRAGAGIGRGLGRTASEAVAGAPRNSQEKGQAGAGEKPRTVFIGNNKASYHPDKQEWRTRYYQDGRRCMRTYSAKYYGYDKAKCLAECFIRFVQTYGALPSQQTLLLAAERLQQQQALAQSGDKAAGGDSCVGGASAKPSAETLPVSGSRQAGGDGAAAASVSGRLPAQEQPTPAPVSSFPFAPALPQAPCPLASQSSLPIPAGTQTPGTAAAVRPSRASPHGLVPGRRKPARDVKGCAVAVAAHGKVDETRVSRRAGVKRRRDSAGGAADESAAALFASQLGPLGGDGRAPKLVAQSRSPRRLDSVDARLQDEGLALTSSDARYPESIAKAVGPACVEASALGSGRRGSHDDAFPSPVAEMQRRLPWSLLRTFFPAVASPSANPSGASLQAGDGVSAPAAAPDHLELSRASTPRSSSVSPASLANALAAAAGSKGGKTVKFSESEDGGQSPRERKTGGDLEAATAEAGRESRGVKRAGKRSDGRPAASSAHGPHVAAGKAARSDSKANLKSPQETACGKAPYALEVPEDGGIAEGAEVGLFSKTADVSTVESALDEDRTASLLQAFFDGCVSESLLGGVPLGHSAAANDFEQDESRAKTHSACDAQGNHGGNAGERQSTLSSLIEPDATSSASSLHLVSTAGSCVPAASTSSLLVPVSGETTFTQEARETAQLLRDVLSRTDFQPTALGHASTDAASRSAFFGLIGAVPQDLHAMVSVSRELQGQSQDNFALPGSLARQGLHDHAHLWGAFGAFGNSAEAAERAAGGSVCTGRSDALPSSLGNRLEGRDCGDQPAAAGTVQNLASWYGIESLFRSLGVGAGDGLDAQKVAHLLQEGEKLVDLHDASLRTVSTLPGALLDALSDFFSVHRLSEADAENADRQASETQQRQVASAVSPTADGASEPGGEVGESALHARGSEAVPDALAARDNRPKRDFPLTLSCAEAVGGRLMNSHVASLTRIACATEAPLFSAFSSALAALNAPLQRPLDSGSADVVARRAANGSPAALASPSSARTLSQALAAIHTLSLRTLRAATEAAQAAVAAARAEQEASTQGLERSAEREDAREARLSSGAGAAGPEGSVPSQSSGAGSVAPPGLGESDDGSCSTSDSSSRLNDSVLLSGNPLPAASRDSQSVCVDKLDDSSPRSDAERRTDVPVSPTNSQGAASHLASEKSDSEGRNGASLGPAEDAQRRAALVAHLRRMRHEKEGLAKHLLEKFWALRKLQDQVKERVRRDADQLRARERHEATTRVGTCAALAQQLFRDNVELFSMILSGVDAQRKACRVQQGQGDVCRRAGSEERSRGNEELLSLKNGSGLATPPAGQDAASRDAQGWCPADEAAARASRLPGTGQEDLSRVRPVSGISASTLQREESQTTDVLRGEVNRATLSLCSREASAGVCASHVGPSPGSSETLPTSEQSGESRDGEAAKTGTVPESRPGFGTQREGASDEGEDAKELCLREALQCLQDLCGGLRSRQDAVAAFANTCHSLFALQRQMLHQQYAALVERDVEVEPEWQSESSGRQAFAEETNERTPSARGELGEARLPTDRAEGERAGKGSKTESPLDAKSGREDTVAREADASPREGVSTSGESGQKFADWLDDSAESAEPSLGVASADSAPTLSSMDTHSGVGGQHAGTSEDEMKRHGSDVGLSSARRVSVSLLRCSSDETPSAVADRTDVEPLAGSRVPPAAMGCKIFSSAESVTKDGQGSEKTDCAACGPQPVSVPSEALSSGGFPEPRIALEASPAAAVGLHELLQGARAWPSTENKWILLQSLPCLASTDSLSQSVAHTMCREGKRLVEDETAKGRILSKLALSRSASMTAAGKEECASKETAAFLLSLQTENVPSMPEISTFLHLKGNGPPSQGLGESVSDV
ncbi:unnamed protein product [Neospora caninum Liverpool]|uniref:AP2 domain transcription factor AP2VIII-3 n=1 Tax=Neospora caninum (strain Liverpool) TaxID=572307 RepID=F0VIQ5_NEOCL|nr:uncharacterized protein NCLIV_034030 [Neospora caninum Liverpool]CBZ53616.1 unnamed protein product [Neospora caninum Liverpool]CEL67607.1 TPA: AP2 domain transcription factor AP2VIII-3 [Neospora caninum Liverpool]|eukprot:XP_003883648.1 uncharacterized protein NCLIV_034030 [Neospora caninum Liverpool]